MTRALAGAFWISWILACGSPTPRPPADLPPTLQASGDDEIVAIYDGRPLTWREVAEAALDSDLKHAVDQCVRRLIIQGRRSELGIANTTAELRRRAEAAVRQAKAVMGEPAFRDRLSREGITEEGYVDRLAGSRLLDETLALEKIVRYEELRRGTLEIDWMIFTDEGDACRFAELCARVGFDAAAEGFRGSGRTVRRPVEVFPPGMPPSAPPLDARVADLLAGMKPGDVTGVEPGAAGLYHVIRLVSRRPGLDAPFRGVNDELVEGILRNPPRPEELRRWVEAEFARARIEYAANRRRGRPGSRQPGLGARAPE